MRMHRTGIFIAACAAWSASWFLPAVPDVPGWAAFRFALAPLVPLARANSIPFEEALPQVLSALTNVVFAILAALRIAKQSPRAGLLVRIALAAFLINLYWFVRAWREHQLSDLRVGYYVWVGAFALLLASSAADAFSGVSVRRTSRTPTADKQA